MLSFRHKIQCSLFGAYVDLLNGFLGAGDVQNVVVILQFAKAKKFQGWYNLIFYEIYFIFILIF
jgi:hypothetical protein